jgi:hypothetical protein
VIVDLSAERDKRRTETETSCRGPARMTDAEFAAQSERVEKMIRALIPVMGLANYTVTLNLVPGLIDDESTVMTVSSDYRYEWATITASVEMCATESDSDLAYCTLHEGAHVHLSLVRPETPSDDHRNWEEMAATRLGRMAQAYGQLCADQVREDLELAIAERDAEIAALKKRLARATKRKAA